jgi:hypothetical protein
MIFRVSKFARLYRADYLEDMDINLKRVQSYWFDAFRFLSSKMLAQGRPNSTTKKIRQMVNTTVMEHFDCSSADGIVNTRPNHFVDARETFQNMRVEGLSYKRKNDVDMIFGADTRSRGYNTLGLLRYMTTLPQGNIVKHSIEEISKGRLIPHYRKLTSFYGVGPIAVSTYLRDLIDLYYDDVGNKISTIQERAHIQPVDACVKRVATEVGIEFDNETPLAQGQKIAEACSQVGSSSRLSIEFSQGASWICTNAFEAALRLLGDKGLGDDMSKKFE